MCILCGNDVNEETLFIYQKTIRKLEDDLLLEKSRLSQLTDELQEVEHDLYIEKSKVSSLIEEINSIQIEQCDAKISLQNEILNKTNFFSILRVIVDNGFINNPFYSYKSDSHERFECSDEEVIKKVESSANKAISKIELDDRLLNLEFDKMTNMIDDSGDRYIQISFEATYTKLLPCELHVLMKAGENAFSNSVYITNNEIHMNHESKKDWLSLFYHTVNLDRSIHISFSFNFYCADSYEYSSGREHAIRFVHAANNAALMYNWIEVEKKNSALSHKFDN